jgi:hydroquinone glucosyltransferase
MEKSIHIAVVPGVGYSHLFPIIQFSKLLVHFHPYIHITCFIPSHGSLSADSKTILQTLPSNINCTFLPPVNSKDLPQGVPLEIQLQLTLTHSLPSIHQALKSLTLRTPFVALIVDSFAIAALDLAKDFNMLSYIYFPSAATTLSTYFYILKHDEETSDEYKDLPDQPIQIPGCVPIRGRDLVDQAQNRSSQSYKYLLQRVKRFRLVDGMLINSFLEIEKGPIEALAEGSGNPLVYAVGPIIQEGTETSKDDANRLECLSWLDKQQPCSVLYVSFGSGGTLSQEQIDELALGLELSNHKFLWVARAPSNLANSAYLSESDVDPLQFLPSGFLERTKEQGMVVPSWAPQIQILSHSSVGGFLTHCGWNSILESVVHGVPLITWPLFAEQKMNAVLLSEGLKVGLRTRVNENDIVERLEVAKVIKYLMEGEEGEKLRNNMKELKEAASNAVKEDGSSTKSISQLALKWRNLV